MGSPLPPVPDGINLGDDKRPGIVVGSVFTYALAVGGVALRIASRRIRTLDLGLDDWLAITSLVPALGHVAAVGGYAVSRGLGLHVWVASPEAIYAWALGLFVAEICYFVTLVLVKLSILAFYYKTFDLRRTTISRIAVWALVFITCAWGVATLLVTFLQCKPINALWEQFDPTNPTSPDEYECAVDAMTFFVGNAIPNIATDQFLMALPLPHIWKIRLPLRQKLALVGIFAVGTFVTVISVVRLAQVVQLDLTNVDITWNFVEPGTWSIVEGNIAILCCCLPFMKPVINKISSGFFGSSIRNNTSKSGTNKTDQTKGQPASWNRMSYVNSRVVRGKAEDEHPLAQLSDDGSEIQGVPRKPVELKDLMPARCSESRGITVTTEFVVDREHAEGDIV